jgi:hypothetical protein
MQKLWPVKVCCPKLTKTNQTVQFGLISDWTSRERGQSNLNADLTFFRIFFFRNFFNIFLTGDQNLTHDSGNNTGEIGRNEQKLITLGWGNRDGETVVTCVAAEMALAEVHGVVAEVYG